jgi:hypothetical protein
MYMECSNRHHVFLETVVIGDESWMYEYDPETKVQSSQWKDPTFPKPKKARNARSNAKVILFFFYRGVVYHEYESLNQTDNNEYYQDKWQNTGTYILYIFDKRKK